MRSLYATEYRVVADVRMDVLPLDGKDRHFAGCRTDGKLIVLRPEIAELPVSNLVAILAHEMGHAVDFLYPGRFQLVDGELVEWVGWDPCSDVFSARHHQWLARDDDAIERVADAIGERAIGRQISYSGPCMLQTVRPGVRPRPAGLE